MSKVDEITFSPLFFTLTITKRVRIMERRGFDWIRKIVTVFVTAFLMISTAASAVSADSFTVDGRTLANDTPDNIIIGSGERDGLVIGHGSANAGPGGTSAGVVYGEGSADGGTGGA